MTILNNPKKIERFIHEIFHSIAKDEELMDVFRDLVSIIVAKWETYKEEYIEIEDDK